MAVIYVCDVCDKVKDKYFYEDYGYEGENTLLCQDCFDKANPKVYITLICWGEGLSFDDCLEFSLKKQEEEVDKSGTKVKKIKTLKLKTLIKNAEKYGLEEYDGSLNASSLTNLLLLGYTQIDDSDTVDKFKLDPKKEDSHE